VSGTVVAVNAHELDVPASDPQHRSRRSFYALWLSSTSSNLGDGVMVSAFPLLAAAITRDPIAVAAMTACASAPWLLFGLPAGAVVDRVDRLRLMRVVDVVRAGIVALLAVAVTAGADRLLALYATVFALGCAETLYDSAAMSVLPGVVDGDELERANGHLFAGQLLTNQFVGPPLGAVLFTSSRSAPLWIDAITFLASAALLLGVRGDVGTIEPEPQDDRLRTLRADIGEGLRWIWGQHDIRLFAAGAAVINLAETAGMSIAVLYATGRLGMTPGQFGWVFAAAAVGALAGTLLTERTVRLLGRRNAIIASVWLFAGGFVLVGAVPHRASLATGLAATSFAAQTWNVVAVAYRQRATPAHLLGRVMSAYRVIAYGSFPLGAVLGGVLTALTSPRFTFVAAGGVVVALAAVIATRLGSLDDSAPAGSPAAP
jgi:MFS family permease